MGLNLQDFIAPISLGVKLGVKMVTKLFYVMLLFNIGLAGLGYSSSPKPSTKVFLFLKEPLRAEESVVIRLNNTLEENVQLKVDDKSELLQNESVFEIVYQKKHQGVGNEILVDLSQGGLISLDVYDFYGKKLGNLFAGYQPNGVMVLNENEKWKVFNRFKGIVYFTLTVDGRLVKKKLLAKVE